MVWPPLGQNAVCSLPILPPNLHQKLVERPTPMAADGSASASGLDFGGGTLDDFTVEKAIGRGHFSVVHRAIRKSDEMRVALKKVEALRVEP